MFRWRHGSTEQHFVVWGSISNFLTSAAWCCPSIDTRFADLLPLSISSELFFLSVRPSSFFSDLSSRKEIFVIDEGDWWSKKNEQFASMLLNCTNSRTRGRNRRRDSTHVLIYLIHNGIVGQSLGLGNPLDHRNTIVICKMVRMFDCHEPGSRIL